MTTATPIQAPRSHGFLALGLLLALLVVSAMAMAQEPSPDSPAALNSSPPAPVLRVVFQDGLLTIEANNASLGAVLDAVRAKTGVVIERSGGEDQARVITRLGPAQPATVIASLLYGTTWNYAVLGSLSDPGKIDRIVLIARQQAQNEMGRMSGAPSTVIAPADASAANAADNTASSANADKDEAADASKDDKKDESAKAEGDDDKDKDKDAKDKDANASAEKKPKDPKKDADKKDGEDTDAVASAGPTGPPVFPDGLYRMYRNLFGGGGSEAQVQTGVTASASGGSAVPSLYAAMGGQSNGGLAQADLTEAAPTMHNYPPELWKLYPPNLSEMVKSVSSPPPAIPSFVPAGTAVFWDQSINVP